MLCLRVTGIRVSSTAPAVAAAGGVGMILYDPPQVNVAPTDNHVIPTVARRRADAAAIAAYIEAPGAAATASFTAGTRRPDPATPGHGRVLVARPDARRADIIKPDVTAPGVQILAGNSPTPFIGAPGQLFQAIQGTSMSSPHVAGIGALLSAPIPTGRPAMIQSALMTTGSQDVAKEDGVDARRPVRHRRRPHPARTRRTIPASCTTPTSTTTWRSCAATATSGRYVHRRVRVEPIDPSDLNLASIGIGALAGVANDHTVTVTNVGPAGTYTASVVAAAGHHGGRRPTRR